MVSFTSADLNTKASKMLGFSEKRIVLPASPVLRPTGKPRCFRQGLCTLIALTIIAQVYLAIQYLPAGILDWGHLSENHVANSTLGFGKIYAVSRAGSPRQQSLMDAASLTSLEISIPVQPAWSEEDIASIQSLKNPKVDRGSALAWLGHRNALEQFLSGSEETALIMEDDVDWDTRLRTRQIPQTAFAIRELLRSDRTYYGDLAAWDIIWLGHCGDYFNATRGSDISHIKSFHDPTMPKRTELHPYTRDFLREIGADQDQQRLVHESVKPLCTFAYAVTRHAAERIVFELAVREPQRESDHPCTAYDVRLLEGCRDEGMRCISVNPELFHHAGLGSEIAQATINQETDEEQSQGEMIDMTTNNIRCSARSPKWKELQDSITDPVLESEVLVKELAELSSDCYINDF